MRKIITNIFQGRSESWGEQFGVVQQDPSNDCERCQQLQLNICWSCLVSYCWQQTSIKSLVYRGIPILVVLIVILVARVTVRTILHSFAGGCYLLGLCRPHHISWCAGYNGDTHRWHHPRWSHITLLHFAQETGVSTTTLTSIQLYMCSCLSMFLTNQEFDLFTYQRQVFHQFMFSFVPSSH